MINHYYSSHPDVVHRNREFDYILLNNKLHFITDNGVFSKKTIDFGTRTLLDALMKNIDLWRSSSRILDMGCGYGPIGISIAKYNPNIYVDMVDINDIAVSLTRKNIQLNLVSNANVFSSNVFENVKYSNYDMIISNPPIRAGKKKVYEILDNSYNYLGNNGILTVVIQKKQGALSAEKELLSIFNNCSILSKNKGYIVFYSKKVML